MSGAALVTMQATVPAGDGQGLADRLAFLMRTSFDGAATSTSVSVQPHDVASDTCATCGCVIGDPEQHAAWHASQIRALGEQHDEPALRTFGEETRYAC